MPTIKYIPINKKNDVDALALKTISFIIVFFAIAAIIYIKIRGQNG